MVHFAACNHVISPNYPSHSVSYAVQLFDDDKIAVIK